MKKALLVFCIVCVCFAMGCGKEESSTNSSRPGERPVIESTLVPAEEVGNALHQAVAKGDKAAVEKLLVEGANVDAKDEGGNTPLHVAAGKGYVEIARLLVEKGANLESKNLFGFSPVQEAEKAHNEEMVQFFLSQGVDKSVNELIELGQTELAAVKMSENPEAVNQADSEGKTPLHAAVEAGDRGIVELLSVSNVNLNAMDREGKTPLMYAIENNKEGITTFLIEQAADVNLKNKAGKTALMLGIEKGDPKMVEMLISEGAETNVVDPATGDTPLHMAARLSDTSMEMVTALLNNGAKVDVKNDEGKTPLDIAEETGNGEVVPALKVRLRESAEKVADASRTRVAGEDIQEATTEIQLSTE